MVIPSISVMLVENGGNLPPYTLVVMGISNFLVKDGFILLGLVIVAGFFLIRFIRTPAGHMTFDRLKISIPYVSSLYKKLYLSRMSDNLSTMLVSGIPMVRALELTSNVVDNVLYEDIIRTAVESVKGGKTLSDSLSNNPKEIPGIMVQMIKVGEETGESGTILKTLARFYAREVETAVDSLVSLIEPLMIVMLGGGVAILLASVLVPIYSIASGQ